MKGLSMIMDGREGWRQSYMVPSLKTSLDAALTLLSESLDAFFTSKPACDVCGA